MTSKLEKLEAVLNRIQSKKGSRPEKFPNPPASTLAQSVPQDVDATKRIARHEVRELIELPQTPQPPPPSAPRFPLAGPNAEAAIPAPSVTRAAPQPPAPVAPKPPVAAPRAPQQPPASTKPIEAVSVPSQPFAKVHGPVMNVARPSSLTKPTFRELINRSLSLRTKP